VDDAQLVAGALAGKAECFDELYRRYRGRVQGWMTREGMPESSAEDRAQKVLAAVCRKLAQFDPSRAQFSTWVYGFIRNEVLSYWREQGRHPEPDSLDELPEECLPSDADGPETVPERKQVQEGVRELVCQLPAKLREPVILFWFKEMTVAEIARFLKRPDSTVRDQLKEAMRELRRLIATRPDLEAMR
jgi:RNA polymerase sigma-70 factor (ECF subfamily)